MSSYYLVPSQPPLNPLKNRAKGQTIDLSRELKKERTVQLHFKQKGFFLRSLVVGILLIFPRLTSAAAFSPMEVIREGTDKVLTILNQSQTGQAHPLRQREGEILAVVSNYFDFDEMSKRSLGVSWKQQPSEKNQEFTGLFRKLLFNTYVDRMENYHNEKIFYDSQKVDGDYAVVKTHFLYQSDDIAVDYRLHREGEQWKVYDVVVEGISYVNNYRSQIASILANRSFEALLSLLRQKVERHG
jgi:phospholipid transport system substrate-binding protein